MVCICYVTKCKTKKARLGVCLDIQIYQSKTTLMLI